MSTILAQARLRACRHWPFASHAILSMVPVPRPGLGTLAVDQHWRLYYDEAALERLGTEQAAGLILHELDHLLKRHHKRGKPDGRRQCCPLGYLEPRHGRQHQRRSAVGRHPVAGRPDLPGEVRPAGWAERRGILPQPARPAAKMNRSRSQSKASRTMVTASLTSRPMNQATSRSRQPVKMGKIRTNPIRTGLTTILKGKDAMTSPDGSDSQGGRFGASGASASDVGYGENSQVAMATPAWRRTGPGPCGRQRQLHRRAIGARPRRFLLGWTAPPVGTRPARRRQPRPGRSRSGATGPRHRQERPGEGLRQGRWRPSALGRRHPESARRSGCQAAEPRPPLLRRDRGHGRSKLPPPQPTQRQSQTGHAQQRRPAAANHGHRRYVRLDGRRRISAWHSA